MSGFKKLNTMREAQLNNEDLQTKQNSLHVSSSQLENFQNLQHNASTQNSTIFNGKQSVQSRPKTSLTQTNNNHRISPQKNIEDDTQINAQNIQQIVIEFERKKQELLNRKKEELNEKENIRKILSLQKELVIQEYQEQKQIESEISIQKAKERASLKELESIRALLVEKRKVHRKAQNSAQEQIDSYLQMRQEVTLKIESKLKKNIQESLRENQQVMQEEGIVSNLEEKVHNQDMIIEQMRNQLHSKALARSQSQQQIRQSLDQLRNLIKS
eukprot:403335270